MKISVSFMMLLLLGSVPASESVECQRAFPEDIYAALRETTASLVQLKADMTLQTTGQAQLKTELDKLKQQQQVRQVAFSTSLLAGGKSATIGPFPSDYTLIFRHVTTNIGNAYNSNTGLFTAPVRGAYHFELHVGGENGAHASGCWLVKNAENVFIAYENQVAGFMSSSSGVTLLLEVGDVVFVRMVATTFVFDNGNHHTTFSGHLLFTM
ncbi:complement C1q-like protein 4 [Perca fluviatilis]|uniref:complement C1q-like protein 4 n=1 Tax=Perca fluviatilis TaxID=8168 RepID=UPI0019652B1C|nr:complement C1q-like protein 4 [Perca fluviatilis]